MFSQYHYWILTIYSLVTRTMDTFWRQNYIMPLTVLIFWIGTMGAQISVLWWLNRAVKDFRFLTAITVQSLSECRNSIGKWLPASLEERISCTLIIKCQLYILGPNNYGWKCDQIKIESEHTKLSLEKKKSFEIRVYGWDICNYTCKIAR